MFKAFIALIRIYLTAVFLTEAPARVANILRRYTYRDQAHTKLSTKIGARRCGDIMGFFK